MKLLKSLFMALLTVCGMSACSSSDEGPAPKLENISVSNVSELTEAGEMTATIRVVPSGAQIAEATSSPGFAVESLVRKGDGEWTVTLKVTDFSALASSGSVSLTVSQPDGIKASAEIPVTDPFSVEGKYGLVYPKSYTLYDSGSGKAIGLPLIVTADKLGDLADVAAMRFISHGNVISNGWQASWFELQPISDEVGCFLLAKKEAIDKISNQKVPQSLGTFAVAVIDRNGRQKVIQLENLYACCPETTFRNDELQMTLSQLADAGFRKEGRLDVSAAMRRIGLYEGRGPEDIDWAKVGQHSLGMTDKENAKISTPFAACSVDFKTFELSYTLSGTAGAGLAAGTYNDVVRYVSEWSYRGKTYQRIVADVKYEITLN